MGFSHFDTGDVKQPMMGGYQQPQVNYATGQAPPPPQGGYGQPMMGQPPPMMGQPGYGQPVMGQPGYGQPMMGQQPMVCIYNRSACWNHLTCVLPDKHNTILCQLYYAMHKQRTYCFAGGCI